MTETEIVIQRKTAQTGVVGWATQIREVYGRFTDNVRRGLADAIELGTRLTEAKKALQHGEFTRLFKGHRAAIDEPLPFTRKWAHRLMRIAVNPTIVGNVQHAGHLPPDIETVYALATIPEGDLKRAIKSKKVHSAMTRAEAVALCRKHKPDSEREPEEAGEPDAAGEAAEAPKKESRTLTEAVGECLSAIEAAIAETLQQHPKAADPLAKYLQTTVRGLEQMAARQS